MNMLEQGTRNQKRKYEEHGAGRSRSGSGKERRGSNSATPSEAIHARTADERGRVINPFNSGGDPAVGAGSQRPQPGPSGLSKYGSSVTVLRVDGPLKQQRKAPRVPRDLKRFPESENAESEVVRKLANQIDFHKLKQGLPRLPPTNRDLDHHRYKDAEKASRRANSTNITIADKVNERRRGGVQNKGKASSKSPVRRATPVFGQDNQINYKLMEKIPIARLTPADVRCLEEAIHNLDAQVPTQPEKQGTGAHALSPDAADRKDRGIEKAVAMPIFSQKQMVESLEQIFDQSRARGRTKTESNPLYRQCLKIHHLFLHQIEALEAQTGADRADQPPKLPVSVQVDILLQLLNQHVVLRAQRHALAQKNARRCSMQKGFIALLSNMMDRVAGASGSQTALKHPQSSSELSMKGPERSTGQPNAKSPSVTAAEPLKGHATFGLMADAERAQLPGGAEDVADLGSLARQPSHPSNPRHSNQNLDLYFEAESEGASLRSSRLEEPTARDYAIDQRQNQVNRNEAPLRGAPEAALADGVPYARQDQLQQDEALELDEAEMHLAPERQQQVQQTSQQLKSILKSPQSRLLNGKQQKCVVTASDEKANVEAGTQLAEAAEGKSKSMEKNSPGKSPKASPERQAARQIEKDNSPVREFLNQEASEDEAAFADEKRLEENGRELPQGGRKNKMRVAATRQEDGFQMDKVEVHDPGSGPDSNMRPVSPLSSQSNPLQMPDIVLQTSMFDKGHYDAKSSQIAQPRSPHEKGPTQVPGGTRTLPNKEEINEAAVLKADNKEGIWNITDTTPAGIMDAQSNYKLLLKCVRLWRIYAKQEIYRREQARILEVEQARQMQERLDSEIELSREISGIIHECAIARNHYNNHLMLSSFQSLFRHLKQQRRQRSQATKELMRGHRERTLGDYFAAWRMAVENTRATRVLQKSLLMKRQERMQLGFIFKIREALAARQNKRNRFITKSTQLIKQRVYQALAENLRQSEDRAGRAEHFRQRSRGALALAFRILQNQNPEDRQRQRDARQAAQSAKAARILRSWAGIAQVNRKMRHKFQAVHAASSRQVKARTMAGWREARHVQERSDRVSLLLRGHKVLRAFKRLVAQRKRKLCIQAASVEHLEKVRQRLVMARWKAYVLEIQQYRNVQLQVFTKFDLFKQRQIFKQWFNQVDVLKKWRFLNENTHLWYIKKMRKRVFRAWRSEIRLRAAYFAVEGNINNRLGVAAFKALQQSVNRQRAFRYVHEVRSLRTGQHVLRHWYSLLNEKLRTRLKMQKKRDFYTLSACFDELREYADKRLGFKRGMKSLLKTRAKNLLRIAFLQGLKQIWHQRVIDRSLNQAAELFYRVSQQKSAFAGLKRVARLRWCAESTRNNRVRWLQRACLGSWLRQYLKLDAAARYQKRRQTDIVFKVLKVLSTTAAREKGLRRRLLFFQKIHEQYLTMRGFASFALYSRRRREGRARQQQLREELYYARLQKRAFHTILKYSKASKEKGTKKALYTDIGLKLRKRRAMNALKRKYELKTKEREIRRKVSNRTKQHCMGALIYNQAINVAEKLVGAKGKTRTKARVFDGLARYGAYKKYFAEQEAQMVESHACRVKSAVFLQLRLRAARKQSERRATAAIHQLRARRFLMAWREEFLEAVDQRKQRRAADQLFGKRIFEQLKKACLEDRDSEKRKIKQKLRKIQMTFHRRNSKRRALRRLQNYKQLSQMRRIRDDYVQTIQLKKIFGAWVDALDSLRRARILHESAKIMQRNSLVERAVRALRERADKKIKERLIIERFQERAEMTVKADVLLSLHHHVSLTRNQRSVFYKKILFVAERRVARPFLQWMEYVLEHRLEERADKFFRRRKAQYLFRLAWDSLRVFSLHSRQKRTQHHAIDDWHNRMLLQRTTLALRLHAHESKRLTNVSSIIKLQSDQAQLGAFFEAFTEGLRISKANTEIKRKAALFYEHNQYRKTLIGFQLAKHYSKRAKILRERRRKALRRECMLKWYKGLIFKRRLQALTDILQRENDCRMAYAFFPVLVKQTYVLQIFDHMAERRVHNYQVVFINRLRKQILMKKILRSFRQRSLLELKRAILVELKISAYQKQTHKDQVASHLWQVESEHHSDVLQIAFNSLKERVVLQKFKRISLRCHKLKILRKYFCALQEHEIRRKMDRKKAEEVRKMSEAKHFWHWRRAFIKEQEKDQAAQFLQSTFLYQVMSAWRAQTNKRVRSRSFFANVVQRNQMQSVLHAWILHVKTEQKNRECAKYLALLHRQNLEKKYILIWLSKLSQGRIESQMGNYFVIKTYRRVFAAWKLIKDKNNEKRLRMYRIRAELRKRPELARPLKALKNFLAFKAFNKLLEGAHQSRSEEVKEEDALFAYYLQLSKKAFVGLKLGAQLQAQREQTVEMGELNMKKRYLDLIKKGTAYLKERRKMRHKSSIFRFLSLQRKALQGFMKYQTLTMELRVKKEYALRLYYKRMIDLGFSCLRIYTREKKAAREERNRRREEEATDAIGSESQPELQRVHEHEEGALDYVDGLQVEQDSSIDGERQPSSQRPAQQRERGPEEEARQNQLQQNTEASHQQLDVMSQQHRYGRADEDARNDLRAEEGLDRQRHKASAPHLRVRQHPFSKHLLNQMLPDEREQPTRMAAAAMYPSVGAINNFQGASDGYNIFHNISGGSGLTSAQLSTQQVQPVLQHERSTEPRQDQQAQHDEACSPRGVEHLNRESNRQSAVRYTVAQPSRGTGADEPYGAAHGGGRRLFDNVDADELDQVEEAHVVGHGKAHGADDDAFSLQSPPKEQTRTPLVMKIDDLLRDSRRADFSLQLAEQTSTFEMNRTPEKD